MPQRLSDQSRRPCETLSQEPLDGSRAALIRQESIFNPRVRSSAEARGLMQIMPSTGRTLARQERRQYNLAKLYNSEINILCGLYAREL